MNGCLTRRVWFNGLILIRRERRGEDDTTSALPTLDGRTRETEGRHPVFGRQRSKEAVASIQGEEPGGRVVERVPQAATLQVATNTKPTNVVV